MGMFDNVEVPEKVLCPNCQEPVAGWQSKDGDCLLEMLSVDKVDHFYTSCPCGTWIQFNRKIERTTALDDFEMTHRPTGAIR